MILITINVVQNQVPLKRKYWNNRKSPEYLKITDTGSGNPFLTVQLHELGNLVFSSDVFNRYKITAIHKDMLCKYTDILKVL